MDGVIEDFVCMVVYVGLLMLPNLPFLAGRTNGRAYATVLRLSVVVCDVMYCG